MSDYYKDKVAAVTGAAAGIGLGLTEKLLAEGAMAVFMGDVNQESLTRESQRLNLAYPGKVFTALTDVTVQEQVEGLIHGAAEHDGHLYFVFNNAGMGMTIPTEQVTFDIWRFLLDLNLLGVIYGTYTAIPIMREQGFGHIVNTGSAGGLMPMAYQALYAATKSAVITMTECLQYELETEGLRFSVFNPGNVITSIFAELAAPPPDAISVEEATDYIFEELAKGSTIIVLPQKIRDLYRLYLENRAVFDQIARGMASERRENYRTKGTYY